MSKQHQLDNARKEGFFRGKIDWSHGELARPVSMAMGFVDGITGQANNCLAVYIDGYQSGYSKQTELFH